MEQTIKEYILGLGVDDVGFAAVEDYQSPKSYDITKFLPDAKSIIVLAFRALSSCESPSMSAALNGLLDLSAFARSASYRSARFLEDKYDAKVANMPLAYPFELTKERKALADFSQRHAAVAAGLGSFGRNNLVIHPRFGTRVNFASIITNIPLQPSPKSEQNLCLHCNICVDECPGGALDQTGKTDIMKCIKHSQPYGLGANISFWSSILSSTPDEQKAMLLSDSYARIQQAAHLGNQYMCFNCMKTCPIGRR